MMDSERALNAGAGKWGLPLKAPSAAPKGHARREGDRAVAYWGDKVEEFGDEATITALDLDAIDSADWANRFVIAIDPRTENSTLLLYGPRFAELLNLPPEPRTDLPLARQVPPHLSEVFLQGCARAPEQSGPVRIEGQVERPDDGIEQYRAVFISVGVKPNSLTHFAFGAYNSRVVKAAMAA